MPGCGGVIEVSAGGGGEGRGEVGWVGEGRCMKRLGEESPDSRKACVITVSSTVSSCESVGTIIYNFTFSFSTLSLQSKYLSIEVKIN